MIYLICYDIASPKRLAKTAKILCNFGIRVQKSFFQVDIVKERLELLTAQVLKVINSRKDSFYVYSLCDECSRKAVVEGRGDLIRLESFQIL